MELFWKSIAAILVCVIFSLVIGKWENGFALLLSLLACCIVCTVAISFLSPVLDLLNQIEQMSGLDSNSVKSVLKIVGISFVGEIVGLLCMDAGNSSLAKTVSFITNSTILWLSIPIISEFISLLKQMLSII